MKKQLLLTLFLGATLLLLAGCKKTINLNDYLSVSFDGYDTVGTASFRIDEEKMLLDNAKTFKLTDNSDLALASYYTTNYRLTGELDDTTDLENGDKVKFTWDNSLTALEEKYRVKFTFSDETFEVSGLKEAENYNPFDDLKVSFEGYDTVGKMNYSYDGSMSDLYFNADNTSNLKNGDVVKITMSSYYDDLKRYALEKGKLITETEKEYTVEGLTELIDYDPFDDVTVTFSGMSGDGSVERQYSGKLNLSINAEPYSGLSNGDKVTVTVSSYYDDIQQMAAPEGYRVTATTKEYTVEGLTEYMSSLAQLPEDAFSKMDKNAQDVFNAYVASGWDTPSTLKGISYIGSYLLNQKNYDYWNDANYLYLIYKISVVPEEGDPFDYYYYVRYRNIKITAEGECSYDLSDYSNPSGGWFSDEAFEYEDLTYAGYKDLDTMFNQLVTTKIDQYTYESSVTE